MADRDLICAALMVVAGAVLAIELSQVIQIAALLAAVVIAFCSPAGALTGTMAAVPFIYHPVEIHSGHYALLELGILTTSLGTSLWLLRRLLTRQESTRSLIALAHPWMLTALAGLFLLAGVLSMQHLADPSHRAESLRLFRWVIVEPLFVVLVLRVLARHGKQRSPLLGLFVVAAFVSVVAFLDLVTGGGVETAFGTDRAASPYPHPNNLALFLSRIVAAGFTLLLLAGGVRDRVLLILSAVMAFGLILTVSRGGIAAAVIGIAVAGLLSRRFDRRWLTGLVTAGLLAVAGLALIQRLFETGGTGSLSTRELVWRSSWRMVKDHQVWGVGPDQFLYQYGRRYVDPAGWAERYTSHPHNVVLDFWLSLGIPGLVCLAGMIAVVAIEVFRMRAEESTDLAFQWAAVAALVAGFAHGLVDNSYFLPDLAVMTWLFVSIAVSTEQPAVMLFDRFRASCKVAADGVHR